MLFQCQPHFERWLSEEIESAGTGAIASGGGWVRTAETELPTSTLEQLCFPQASWLDEIEVTGDSVNAFADRLAEEFFQQSRQERFDAPWPLFVETAAELDGLGRRADAVMRAFLEKLKKKMSRVAKLASPDRPPAGEARGWFIYFLDFHRACVARRAFFGGQCRMADDPLAPSRSYLKVEEAYRVLGREPQAGEMVADLGAAPGGWSYSAAKRGARVVAVDNGPLKGGALDHPGIEHRREDAFRYLPEPGERFDWLFCDLVEEPHHVLHDLIEPWLAKKLCRRFVVILKFGRVDPIALLREVRSTDGVFARYAANFRVRHLFHDREEFTIVGETLS